MSRPRLSPSGQFIDFLDADGGQVASRRSTGAQAPIPAGNTVDVILATIDTGAPSNVVPFRTSKPDERVWVTFSVDRNNDNAAGTGSYDAELDGNPTGGARTGGGLGQSAVAHTFEVVVPTPGPHTIGMRCTAAIGAETITSASLVVFGNDVGP